MLIAAYHLFCFTEWIYDLERQFELGWSLITVIVINVIVNLAVLIIVVIKSWIDTIRKKYRDRIRKQRIEQQKIRQSRVNGHKFLKLGDIIEVPESEETTPRDDPN